MAVLTRVSLCLLVLLAAGGCRTGAEQWGPFRGRVIDAETQAPIAGAHVMVLWVREPPALHLTQSFYDARETVTDAEGRFEIRSRTRLFTAWVTGPAVSVFAPGYLMLDPEVTPAGGRRYVDPTVVRMRPLKTREERCKYEPLGITASAHIHVSRFVEAQYEYKVALQCGRIR